MRYSDDLQVEHHLWKLQSQKEIYLGFNREKRYLLCVNSEASHCSAFPEIMQVPLLKQKF